MPCIMKFPNLDLLIAMIKEQEFHKKKSVYFYSIFVHVMVDMVYSLG